LNMDRGGRPRSTKSCRCVKEPSIREAKQGSAEAMLEIKGPQQAPERKYG